MNYEFPDVAGKSAWPGIVAAADMVARVRELEFYRSQLQQQIRALHLEEQAVSRRIEEEKDVIVAKWPDRF